jgi:Flp pilus assembly protein TadB
VKDLQLILGVGLVLLFVWMWKRWIRWRIALARVPTLQEQERVRSLQVAEIETPFETALPWALGFVGAALFVAWTTLGLGVAVAVGVLLWVVGWILKDTFVGRRTLKLEAQLAEAIDHMVTSLHAGIGVLDALSGAEADTRKPLKPHLTTLITRLKLGDEPVQVCKEMAGLLPLESFRLFYYALAVQWEGGGNLAPTLATTGRFIRDRVELGRRIRAQTSEARFSVLAILGLTYFLAGLMYHLDPTRVAGFIATSVGQAIAAFSIVLQALGALWIARLSRIQF